MSTDIVKYETTNGEVELSPEIIKKYLVPTGKDGKPSPVTDQEITMFLKLCQYQKLNPFLREVYLIKYGSQPATMVTGKETFLKRAMKNPKYRGHETFITDDGKVATAKVYVENYTVPITVSVDFEEYVGLKDEYQYDPSQGKSVPTGRKVPNGMWASKPKTMLKKVALVQALREAFPDDFGGLYSQEEISHIDTEKLPTAPIETIAEAKEEKKPVAEKPKNEPVPITDIKADLPEDRQNPFVPYAKGGGNIKKKTESKTIFFAPDAPSDARFVPVEDIPAETIKDDLKESSGKLKDQYSVKIANLKTRAECQALLNEMATLAGNFTEQDRTILRAAFESKRKEILDALPKADTAPKADIKVGDKVKVRAKAGGTVILEGVIEKIKTVDGKPAATLKGVKMPVFLANCSLE